jgi:hypothetical protein
VTLGVFQGHAPSCKLTFDMATTCRAGGIYTFRTNL